LELIISLKHQKNNYFQHLKVRTLPEKIKALTLQAKTKIIKSISKIKILIIKKLNPIKILKKKFSVDKNYE